LVLAVKVHFEMPKIKTVETLKCLIFFEKNLTKHAVSAF
jgi:hypothetical protein